MKPWYQSKTIWISILSIILYMLTNDTSLLSGLNLNPQLILILSLIAQAINRFWTNTTITLK